MNVRELKSQAHAVLDEMRELNDRIMAERRDYREDEHILWDKLDKKFHKL